MVGFGAVGKAPSDEVADVVCPTFDPPLIIGDTVDKGADVLILAVDAGVVVVAVGVVVVVGLPLRSN